MRTDTPRSQGAVPLVVTVGVSGHRRRSQLGDLARTRSLIREHFRALRSRLQEANGPVEFILLSPLAEGADRLFVDALREEEPDARLLVPLPFDQASYEASFSAPDAVEDFRRRIADPRTLECFVIPGGSRDEYFSLGRWVVDHADVMFFLHDGADYGDAPRNGGTSSVIQYAWADGDLPGSSDRDGHAVYVYLDTSAGDAVTRGVVRPNPYARQLDADRLEALDARAQGHQRTFDATILAIVSLAFAIGAIVLLDWYSGGNEVFAVIGGWSRWVNWDSLATLALVALIVLVARVRRRGALGNWLESRYLAERLRTLPELLAAGVPPSVVLDRSRRDPASAAMGRAWHSLYLAARQPQATGTPPEALRSRLLERDGFLTSQIDWHLRKAAAKEATQRRWTWARNLLFLLSVLTSAMAAIHFALGNPGAPDLANHLDFASCVLSLLLAAAATMAQVKEHGRIAANYRDTARRLAEVRRTIRFVESGDGPARAAELQGLVVEGTEILMETTYRWMDTMRQKDPDVA
jgi:hypothetical protein